MGLTARYNGTCAGDCGRPIRQGDPIEWSADVRKSWHQGCYPAGNSDSPATHRTSAGNSPETCSRQISGKSYSTSDSLPGQTRTRPDPAKPQETTSPATVAAAPLSSAGADALSEQADRLLDEYERTVLAARGPVQDGTYTVELGSGPDDYVTIILETKADDRGTAQRAVALADSKHPLTSYGETIIRGFAIVRGRRGFAYRKLRAAEDDETRKPLRRLMIGLDALLRSDDAIHYGEAYARQSGKCFVCGRPLTVPISLTRGLGPKCAERWRNVA